MCCLDTGIGQLTESRDELVSEQTRRGLVRRASSQTQVQHQSPPGIKEQPANLALPGTTTTTTISRTIWVSWHQKGKPLWILMKQEMMGWQWHRLDHMQIICTSLQTDNHASTSPLSFYRLDALPAAQPTASKH